VIYCPRCTAEISDNLKYCKGCGLPVESLHAYVAGAGNKRLPASQPGSEANLTPLQRLILTIVVGLSVPMALAVCYALLGDQFLALSDSIKQVFLTLLVVSEVFALPVIVWAIFKYVVQKRSMQPQTHLPAPAPESFLTSEAVNSDKLLKSPTTNPLTLEASVRGSVTEEETKQLAVPRS